MIKGVAVAFFLIILMVAFLPPQAQVLKTSKMVPHIVKISSFIIYIIPDDLKEKFQGKKVQLTEMWEKKYIQEMKEDSNARSERDEKPTEKSENGQGKDLNEDMNQNKTGFQESQQAEDAVHR